jgi:hypothetical protein
MTMQQEQKLFQQGSIIIGQIRIFRSLLTGEKDTEMRETYNHEISLLKEQLKEIKKELYFSDNVIAHSLN